jgi:CRISPR-associated protein (TIGR03986 family)
LGSKIFFKDAYILNKAKVVEKDIKLAILDRPRASNTNFYLDSKENVSYDENGASIKGRKYYWHHKDKLNITNSGQIINSSIIARKEDNSNQITIARPLYSGNSFEAGVYFENLTDFELGALIYSIGLEENMYHKIGHGKPIGLGTIKIDIEEVELFNQNKFDSFDYEKNIVENYKKYIEEYKKVMIEVFKPKSNNFNEIDFIKEFKYITSNFVDFKKTNESYNYPVKKGSTGINTLEWFMKNKNEKLPKILDYK